MGYKAVDVARRMVQLSIDNELWLTNLKLQKVLYFAWVDYYKETNGKHLFDDKKFEAWKYGPVVPDVYYDHWLNVSRLIFATLAPSEDVSALDEFLLKELKKYNRYTAGQLVDMTHYDGSPWKESYVEGRKEEIPFRLIETSARAVPRTDPRGQGRTFKTPDGTPPRIGIVQGSFGRQGRTNEARLRGQEHLCIWIQATIFRSSIHGQRDQVRER